MKNYEQMAEDVFRRRDAYLVRRKKYRRVLSITAAALCCICLTVIAAFGVPNAVKPDTTESTVLLDNRQAESSVTEDTAATTPAAGGIIVRLAASLGQTEQTMEDDIQLPLDYAIAVRDIRGIADERKINRLINEEFDKIGDRVALPNNGGMCRSSRLENIIFSSGYQGIFLVYPDRAEEVEKIRVESTSEYGTVEVMLVYGSWRSGKDVTLYREERAEEDRAWPFQVNWHHSETMLQKLDADPTMSLAEISDSLIFTLTYTDGTTQSCAVDIAFDEEGNGYATYRELETKSL